MFVTQEHHPQLLAPESYRSQAQFDEEIAGLFWPAWHCVGLATELPREGSFRTLELLGNPLLLWRKEGQVHAYLNVCAHRYCLLTDRACGRVERLKCQYHGWEYDETGNVRKIPDARAFKPLEPGMLGLKKFHAETCGQLLFVSLAENPPSLRDFLGTAFEECSTSFNDDLPVILSIDRTIEANWKAAVENALESYHTAEVHPTTFGPYPDETQCRHQLDELSTSFTAEYAEEKSFRRWLDDFGHTLAGAVPTHRYQHQLFYPNLMFSRLSLFRWVESIVPVSPTRSRSIVRVVCNAGHGAFGKWNTFWARLWAKVFLVRVGSEDKAVLRSVQRGLNATSQPLGGLISAREERIFHFQRWILANTTQGAAAARDNSAANTRRASAAEGSWPSPPGNHDVPSFGNAP
jgi:choline monooxygenase